jgi:hypothetical protein
MAKTLSHFMDTDGFAGIYSATKGTLRCTAIKLADGSLCLFSPVLGLTEQVIEKLALLGDVSFILAPNHYHNKGVAEYADAFPKAALVAPGPAIPRIEKVTGISFQTLTALEEKLPNNISIIHTQGLKTGEVWLKVENENKNAWVVVDAFCTMKDNAKKTESDTPQILGTFPKMGVQDRKLYLPWALEQITQDQPSLILPCHGSTIKSAHLPAKLTVLMNETFSD